MRGEWEGGPAQGVRVERGGRPQRGVVWHGVGGPEQAEEIFHWGPAGSCYTRSLPTGGLYVMMTNKY